MYNEDENVERTVSRIAEAMEGMPEAWELIIVNDGSTDGTLAAARALEAGRPWLRVLSYPENTGRGRALRTGFAAARGEIIATTDFDLSYSPDHLRRLYDYLRGNPEADMVLGAPYMPGGTVKDVPLMRYAVSRLGNIILSFAMGGRFTTISSILRAYRREVLESLDLREDKKEIHLEILSKAAALGFRINEVPAHLRGRKAGRSKFRMRITFLTHLIFSFSERPMMIFGTIGLVLLLLGFASGVAIVAMRYMGTLNPTRPFVTLMVLLVVAGIQVFTLGFVSMQIVSLRKEIYKTQMHERRIGNMLKRLLSRDEDSPK
jgi:glycosyltransferase involved in cell wall biosynthesis